MQNISLDKTVDPLAIFSWAQEHRGRIGAYPHVASGKIVTEDNSAADLTWGDINMGLTSGAYGLPEGLTLRQFIESFHRIYVPLDEKKILSWARSHRKQHNIYPTINSGSIENRDADGDTWANVNSAFSFCLRGLEGYSSLEHFLDEQDRKKNILSEELILQWADAHMEQHGSYPKSSTPGIIPGSGNFTWESIDKALAAGTQGLPRRKPRDSLYWLLDRKRRDHQNGSVKTNLTIKKIVDFALLHTEKNGDRPTSTSGLILGTHAENWSEVNEVLVFGGRGFAGGSSLEQFLEEYLPRPAMVNSPQQSNFTKDVVIGCVVEKKTDPVSIAKILEWIDSFHKENGQYPLATSGKVADSGGRTWFGVQRMLLEGEEQVSLAKFIKHHRRVKISEEAPAAVEVAKSNKLPSLEKIGFAPSLLEILTWIDDFHAVEGFYPLASSGKIPGANGKSWSAVQKILMNGLPELGFSISLAKVIKKYRGNASDAKKLIPIDVKPAVPVVEIDPRQITIFDAVDAQLGAESKSDSSANVPSLVSSARTISAQKIKKMLTLPISEANILKWIDAYREKNHEFPRINSGKVDDVTGVSWKSVAQALEVGQNGLQPGGSLSKFIYDQYGVVGNRVVGTPKHVASVAA